MVAEDQTPSSSSMVVVRTTNLSNRSDKDCQNMVGLLEKNLKAALSESNTEFSEICSIDDVILIAAQDNEAAAKVTSRVFGVESASPAITTRIDADEIVESALPFLLNNHQNGISVVFELIGMVPESISPRAFEDDLYEILLKKLEGIGTEFKSSLPQLQIWIEIIQENAYIFTKTLRGLGGLPTGYEGQVVCMISSGLDSPVASFKAMRRGCVPIFVHFDNSPFSDDSNRDIAVRQARLLSEYIHGVDVKMYIVPHGGDLIEILTHAPRRMTCIFCRRNMYRLAQEVALRENADAIITGEIIGEQASQTTRNLLAETSAICKIPIIRPCIGDDKDEIFEKAREIGTYKFAEEAGSCCSLPPKYPTIYAQLHEIPIAEEKMGTDWVKDAVSDAEILILKEVGENV